jgi:predicted CXXCH cytochrome family protein
MPPVFPACIICLTAGLWAAAQEIDTALARQTQSSAFTIIDQIENPVERAAFLQMYAERDSRRRRELATSFIARYQDSWLLGQAYEIAAKASLDLDDLPPALEFGARSLRLWPENALLLVPLASAQAKLSMDEAAIRNANDALWCLKTFDRPSSIAVSDWPRIRQSLRAAAYFVLGRVAATRGLGVTGEDRRRALTEARNHLLQARSLDTTDPEIAYLLGLVATGLAQSGAARPESAAPYFAEARRLHGALANEAEARLRSLYERLGPDKPPGFEAYADSLTLPAPAAEPAVPVPTRPSSFAGSEACVECHRREYDAWNRTGMRRMFREYRSGEVAGDFSENAVVEDGETIRSVRPVLDQGRHYLELRGASGKWTRYPVDYLIGSKWQQAYATRFPGGAMQVFPVQFNRLENKWVNYWKLTDTQGSDRADIHRFGEGVASGAYQFNCAPCHTSQLRFAGGVFEASTAQFRASGVNCEMCHGPSGRHVAGMRQSGRDSHTPGEAPVNFRHLGAEEYVAICAQCHMQSAVRVPEKGGEVNYSAEDGRFYRVSLSRPYIDFSRKAFYKDGRFRVTTFIVESFVRSACFRKGQAQCGSCHDPHPGGAGANPASLKFAPDSDEMCLQCHREFRAKQEAHTRHSLGSEASRCVSCHMPRIMEALLFRARSHQIDDIPDAEMTRRFGPGESPNACLMCHKDRDAAWLSGAEALFTRDNGRLPAARGLGGR